MTQKAGITREQDVRKNGDRQYHVALVDPGALPPGQDFAFLECGDEVWLALKRDRLTAEVLEEAWAAGRVRTAREQLAATA